MLFNTAQYILFLPVAVIVYYILPQRLRHLWLFIASYYFYMQWNAGYGFLLLAVTVITYAAGFFIARLDERYPGEDGDKAVRKKKKICLVTGTVLSVGLLFFFKYSGFALHHIGDILGGRIQSFAQGWNIVLPVGISFYVLQSVGYLIDVYRGDTKAERNFIRYGVFVSFFPQLVAGPIERSGNLLHQLSEEHKLSFSNIRRGFYYILYGLFLKMVIADNLAIAVDAVYENPEEYYGIYIVAATLLFCIQIYCDFYGYSVIARGSALLMGIELMSNFESPFLASSVKETWRRWHISLSSWFKDYLYIPLGGSRKGMLRKEINLLIIFTVSGLWHGASMGYVFWGLLNGIFQVVSDGLAVLKTKMRSGQKDAKRPANGAMAEPAKNIFPVWLLKVIAADLLFAFAVIFFRAGSMSTSAYVLRNMINLGNIGTAFSGVMREIFGFINAKYVFLWFAVLLLLLVDSLKYKKFPVMDKFLSLAAPIRYICFAVLFFGILVFGAYGDVYDAQKFIYFAF